MNEDRDGRGRNLVIYGAWRYAHVVAETAGMRGWNVAGFVDPDPPDGLNTLTEFPADSAAIVAIGDNGLRAFVYDQLLKGGRTLVSILHPTALVSPSATVGDGCYLAEYAVIRANSSVAAGTLLNSGAVVSHDCHVGPFVTFGPNAATGGYVSIGERTLLGVGASVRPHCSIGSGCRIGAGAAVVGDGQDEMTVINVPAKPLNHNLRTDKQSDWGANRIW